ncbi:MAG: glycosyl hydrolase, partial [Verrucomicrobiia bacterium]
TISGARVRCSNPGGEGFEMDWLNAAATDLQFKSMADVLCRKAGPLAGKSLKYVHDDSWEVGLPNWTDGFLAQFKKFRGYDARPYLPVFAGRIVTSAEVSDRFLHDFRKTVADCLADNHYGRLAKLARAKGLRVHCEAGGPCYPKAPP